MVMVLILGFTNSKAQVAQLKNMNGKVIIDEEDGLDTSDVHVSNLRSNFVTKTNDKGQFNIPVKVGDTIQFKAVGLLTRNLVVNPSVFSNGYLELHMNVEIIELQTAMVNPLRLDKFKDQSDMTNLYNQLGVYQKSYKEVKPRVVKDKNDLYKLTAGTFLRPVEVIGHINGYYRKKRNLDFYENENYFASKIINYFPVEYFTTDLKIPEEKIHDFVFFTIGKTKIKNLVNPEKYFDIGLILEEYAPIYLKELYQKENS